MKEIYQHYKGGFYEKITEANSEAFDIPLVVYRSLKDGKQWVRAKALFDEKFTLVAIAENHYRKNGFKTPSFRTALHLIGRSVTIASMV